MEDVLQSESHSFLAALQSLAPAAPVTKLAAMTVNIIIKDFIFDDRECSRQVKMGNVSEKKTSNLL